MRLDGYLDIYQKVRAPDASGELLRSYTLQILKAAVPAGIQPHTLSPVELTAYGISDTVANARLCFMMPDPDIKELMHTQDQATKKWYELRAGNPWPNHDEWILVPIQGGAV